MEPHECPLGAEPPFRYARATSTVVRPPQIVRADNDVVEAVTEGAATRESLPDPTPPNRLWLRIALIAWGIGAFAHVLRWITADRQLLQAAVASPQLPGASVLVTGWVGGPTSTAERIRLAASPILATRKSRWCGGTAVMGLMTAAIVSASTFNPATRGSGELLPYGTRTAAGELGAAGLMQPVQGAEAVTAPKVAEPSDQERQRLSSETTKPGIRMATSIRVEWPNGEPLCRWSITLVPVKARKRAGEQRPTSVSEKTDTDGRASFPDLIQGRYRVELMWGTFEIANGELLTAGSLDHRVVVDGVLVYLQCRDTSGEMKSFPTVRVIATSGESGRKSHTIRPMGPTGRLGAGQSLCLRRDLSYEFLVEGFGGEFYHGGWLGGGAAGAYDLVLAPDPNCAGSIRVRLPNRDLPRTATIEIESLSRAGVDVQPIRSWPSHVEDATYFYLEGLPVGCYQVRCSLQMSGSWGLSQAEYQVEVVGGEEVTLDIEPARWGRIHFQLSELRDVSSKRKVRVRYRRLGEERWKPLPCEREVGLHANSMADQVRTQSGVLLLDGADMFSRSILPGEYEVWVWHSRKRRGSATVTVKEGELSAVDVKSLVAPR